MVQEAHYDVQENHVGQLGPDITENCAEALLSQQELGAGPEHVAAHVEAEDEDQDRPALLCIVRQVLGLQHWGHMTESRIALMSC